MKKPLFIIVMLLGILTIQSQTLSIDNVRKAALRTSDAIKEGSDVKGYYFFYVSDKIDKNTNEYTLRILDNNLKVLKDVKFQDSKSVTILESSFNGTDIIFLFYDSKEKTFEYQVYGADGNKKSFSYTRVLSKKEQKLLESTYLAMDDEDQTLKGLYPLEGKGFISNMPSTGYSVADHWRCYQLFIRFLASLSFIFCWTYPGARAFFLWPSSPDTGIFGIR